MKISKIIIFSFIAFVLISILVLFIDSKNHPDSATWRNMETKTEDLKHFSVLIAENGSDIHVNQKDTNKINIEYSKEKPIANNLYRISNDTLYVQGGNRVFVECNGLKSIITHQNHWLGLENYETDTLRVETNGGNNFIGKDDLSDKIQIETLMIASFRNSFNKICSSGVSNLEISLKDSAYLRVSGHCNSISGELKSFANLSVEIPANKIDLKRLECSQLHIY